MKSIYVRNIVYFILVTLIESRLSNHIAMYIIFWQNVNIQLDRIPMKAKITMQSYIWKILYYYNTNHGF